MVVFLIKISFNYPGIQLLHWQDGSRQEKSLPALSAPDKSHGSTVVNAVDQQIIALKEVYGGFVQLLDELIAERARLKSLACSESFIRLNLKFFPVQIQHTRLGNKSFKFGVFDHGQTPGVGMVKFFLNF